MVRFATLIITACILAGCGNTQPVDLLVHHAKVYTVDSAFSTADAFVVSDGKIIEVGNRDVLSRKYVAREILDAEGNTIYPGFIDAHAHFVGYGRSLFEVNLFDCKDWNEAIARVKEFAAKHPNEPWIRGRGWDQNKWPGSTFPDNQKLNELFPGKPVLLQRIDGHAAIANAKALELAGVSPGAQLVGGTVETKDGKLTGLLIDNAVDLVTKVIPVAGTAEYEKWLAAAQANCFAAGLTTVTDCGLMYNDVAQLDSLERRKKLQMRMYIMLSDDTANYNRYLARGPYKTGRLFVKGIKAYADGALGSRGACLLKEYSDKPHWNGFLLSNASHFDSLAQILINTDFQLCTHAIGDSANRVVLGIYNKYLKGRNDKRWRIEHAQLVNPSDFNLFGNTSVIPSVQPTHATSDMYWAEQRVGGERLKGDYAYKQLLDQNGWLPLGTDFPVEDISPIKTFYAATVRKDSKGYPAGGFQPENAITREQALRGMTCWAAKANCMEREVGSLQPGMQADFVILDRDLMKVEDTAILSAKVLYTYIAGKKVH